MGVDPAIKFTVENNKEDVTMPFLETIVKPEANGKLSITVYRKPAHIDQYLQWDSLYHLSTKYSVTNTLTHRAKMECNKPELLQKEMERNVPLPCPSIHQNLGYTSWCNGLNLQWFETCQSCDEFLTKVRWQNVGYISSSSLEPCCRKRHGWHDCQKAIAEYYLKSYLLRFFHVKCGKWSLNLQAEISGDPTIFEKAMCRMSYPEICATFSMDAIHDSNLL